MSFVHLHNHTEYSILDGLARPKELVAQAKAFGQPAVAITDHGAVHGLLQFYLEAKKQGVKPILGCEFYLCRDHRDRSRREDGYHLVLLARDYQGYLNLLRLSTLAHLEGFYYKPRIDRELLLAHNAGLIGLSGCVGGEIPELLAKGDYEGAKKAALWYREALPAGFYLELQDHRDGRANPDPEATRLFAAEAATIEGSLRLAKETGLPLVATNDAHYVQREDAEVHDVLLCIQTGKTINTRDRLRFPCAEFYLKSTEEMARLFSYAPEALTNTLRIAEECTVEIPTDQILLPTFPVPEGETPDSYLARLCRENWSRIGAPEREEEYRQRLAYELSVIEKMGFASYFLIVWDYVQYAKANGIPVGPGRGSVGGSLVAYLLGLHDVDPIVYDLMFERFLNPDRVSMPDIDLDFGDRDRVIAYVKEKYGADRVAQICTFGTMAAKAAVKDVARVLDYPFEASNRLTKMFPEELGITIPEVLERSEEVRRLYEEDATIRRIFDYAQKLEGHIKSVGVHASGVIISDKPLENYTALIMTKSGVATQYEFNDVEKMGLLKMDFLGLDNVNVIAETVRLVRETRGLELDIRKIPLDDAKTFELLSQGLSLGTFQLESSLYQGLLRRLKPSSIHDVMALMALGRPGPLASGGTDLYIKRKNGEEPVEYLHPKLAELTKSTYGILLYQETCMRAAGILAGYTPGEQDKLRKVIGKKLASELPAQKEKFIAGCVKNGIEPAKAEEIWTNIETFGSYGFNAAHSAAYGLLSYQTAYLKANYTPEYLCALLTCFFDNPDKLTVYLEEARRFGVEVLPPDVNESGARFTLVGGKIRFGLAAIKNVGEAAVNELLRARSEGGPFRSPLDLCRRVNLVRTALESLVKSGALDCFGHTRASLLAGLEALLETARKAPANGRGLFDQRVLAAAEPPVKLPTLSEYPKEELLAMEREVLGFYLSGHPLEEIRPLLAAAGACGIGSLAEAADDERVMIGGLVKNVRTIESRKGRMAFVLLEDLEGEIEVTVFADLFRRSAAYLVPGAKILVEGKVDTFNDQKKVIANELRPLNGTGEEGPGAEAAAARGLRIALPAEEATPERLEEIRSLLRTHPGEKPVHLHLRDRNGRERIVQAGPRYRVTISPGLLRMLAAARLEVRLEKE
ncbi:MAG: DNA polymerase III subunit alpha [Firmicutes bacterium]|nr:DNA polymerase III subunit alpha [Bacillota bacterium]